MNVWVIFFLGGWLFCFPIQMAAQSSRQTKPAMQVSGKVAGVSGVPVPYATVALLRDGAYVKGCTADSSGAFLLSAPWEVYELQVSHLAYRSYRQVLKLADTMATNGAEKFPEVNLGVILLEEEGERLRELVVTGEVISRKADRFVMQVAGVAAFAGKDGTELLAGAPGVWLDDAGISVNGAQGTRVYVNDRQIKLQGEELMLYLRSLNTADIAKVEVLPQAGAEHAADMKGGIIYITLSRRLENGVNGSVQMATSQSGRLGLYAPSGNVSARIGKWSLNAGVSGNFITKGEGRFEGTREYPGEDARFASVSENGMCRDYVTARTEALLDLNKRHTAGLEVSYSDNSLTSPVNTRTGIEKGGVRTGTNSRYEQQSLRRNVSGTFNYLWKLDTLGSVLKGIADYTRLDASGDNLYHTTYWWKEFALDSVSRNTTRSTYDLLTAELALTQKLPHGMELKTGVKYSGNRMVASSLSQGKLPGGWREYPAYGFDLNYREHIGAGYFSLSANVKKWNFSAGLRGEYTHVEGNRSQVQSSYFQLFPNVSVSYALNQMRTWMLVGQYSRNIERPGFFSLNPARIQISDYSYQVGNPYLRPAYVQKVSMTAVWKYRYTLTVGANLNRDLIREVTKTDPENPEVSYVIQENHFKEDHYFVALNAPLMPAKWCNFTVNVVGVWQQIRFTREAEPFGHYLVFANATAGFTLPAGFYAELGYNGHNRLYSGNSEVKGRHTFNASVKKSFLQRSLSLSLAVQNFTDSRNEYLSRTNGFVNILNGYNAQDALHLKFSLSYFFRSGKEFKARRVENTGSGERLVGVQGASTN